jgi:hypothetical protein
MAKETALDTFGAFLMKNLRDRGIDDLDRLLASHWKAPALKKLQRELKALTTTQRTLVRRAFVEAMDSAIHDFLFALQEESDNGGAIRIRVRGKDVATLMHGEPFTEDGWYARFSAHGERSEVKPSCAL